MSFEQQIKKMQTKNAQDRRVVVLFVTILVFVPLLALLIHFGAFTLSSNSTAKKVETSRETESISDTQTLGEMLEEGTEMFESTRAAIEELQQIASSSIEEFVVEENQSDEENASTTLDTEVASSSDEEIATSSDAEEIGI